MYLNCTSDSALVDSEITVDDLIILDRTTEFFESYTNEYNQYACDETDNIQYLTIEIMENEIIENGIKYTFYLSVDNPSEYDCLSAFKIGIKANTIVDAEGNSNSETYSNDIIVISDRTDSEMP